MAYLRSALQTSHSLLRRYRGGLSSDDQQLIDAALKEADETAVERTGNASASPANLLALSATRAPHGPSPRYLGEASDVFFFNSVKSLLVGDSSRHSKDAGVESYERDTLHLSTALAHDAALCLPHRELADDLVDVYFSTIHAAYPFLCKQKFMTDYKLLWESTSPDQEPSIFRSLLCKLPRESTTRWAKSYVISDDLFDRFILQNLVALHLRHERYGS